MFFANSHNDPAISTSSKPNKIGSVWHPSQVHLDDSRGHGTRSKQAGGAHGSFASKFKRFLEPGTAGGQFPFHVRPLACLEAQGRLIKIKSMQPSTSCKLEEDLATPICAHVGYCIHPCSILLLNMPFQPYWTNKHWANCSKIETHFAACLRRLPRNDRYIA